MDDKDDPPVGEVLFDISFRNLSDETVKTIHHMTGIVFIEADQEELRKEFADYLRRGIKSPVLKNLEETEGGYFIPRTFRSPRPGLIGNICRMIGTQFGYITVDLYAELKKRLSAKPYADPATPETSSPSNHNPERYP